MIFQDPMGSFNPSLTVGEQVAEAVEAQRRAGELTVGRLENAGVRPPHVPREHRGDLEAVRHRIEQSTDRELMTLRERRNRLGRRRR
ncbi:hypothetical protein [Natrononativus amylolyticus]|uniref:hypothetical protein n=1 Tax=Natrononativus amylolyticus TaxID=2963434 RepID=UPI0020CF505B|nr:hypothetical protein [Natrononativus amylolyticus]